MIRPTINYDKLWNKSGHWKSPTLLLQQYTTSVPQDNAGYSNHVMLALLNRKHNNSSLSTRSRQRLRRRCFVIQGIDNPCRLAYNCKSPHKPCFAPFNGVQTGISAKGPQTKISVFRCFTIILEGQGKSPVHYISTLKGTLQKCRFTWDIYKNERRIVMTDRTHEIIQKHFSWKYILFNCFHRPVAFRLSLCNLRDINVTI